METRTIAGAAAKLRAAGWTVEHKPLAGEPPYLWRSPDGISGSDYRSHHPDAPPEAVMLEGRRAGVVDFVYLTGPKQGA